MEVDGDYGHPVQDKDVGIDILVQTSIRKLWILARKSSLLYCCGSPTQINGARAFPRPLYSFQNTGHSSSCFPRHRMGFSSRRGTATHVIPRCDPLKKANSASRAESVPRAFPRRHRVCQQPGTSSIAAHPSLIPSQSPPSSP